MKKNLLIIIFLTFSSLYAVAQEIDTKRLTKDSIDNSLVGMPIESDNGRAIQPVGGSYTEGLQYAPADTLNLPTLNSYGQMRPIGLYPLGWMGYYNWDLHQGLNVNIGASVFAAFGKHAPSGAGFAQNISAMYATSLTPKLSLAVGGYFSNVYWASNAYRDGGINAVLGYKFDNHWEGYLYAQKSIMDRPMPPLLYDMNALGDRIGAAVKYNFSPSMSVMISVERRER